MGSSVLASHARSPRPVAPSGPSWDSSLTTNYLPGQCPNSTGSKCRFLVGPWREIVRPLRTPRTRLTFHVRSVSFGRIHLREVARS